jgi:hypothetical protein
MALRSNLGRLRREIEQLERLIEKVGAKRSPSPRPRLVKVELREGERLVIVGRPPEA